ncbi:putative glycosyltransferase [Labedella gwakjiensis]|uniref:Putative glycosyltransferase n=1 Tax=Labedella gwakjiensis TaxID=390269 RepID=A0A2P8GUZ8_9MICO|nr:glycosyltransferase [Labedella gwakjiensis]PSL37792.1 putative glycosyltransferase [Labedella gwakjiensis]RUQ87628.1 hypothetical protein ELQ93_12200 [Labedella gwakjiensis]
MTRPRIGWYVHHHGRGHVSRFLAVRPHLDADVVVFSSMEAPAELPVGTEWVALPLDNEVEERDGRVLDPYDPDAEATVRGRLHWAPIDHRGHRRRLGLIAARADELDAFVVDVSVEVAVFVRLLGLPLALFTQPGARVDVPHELAFAIADRIIAPWPPGTHDTSVFGAGAEHLHTVGGISRSVGRERPAVEPGTVLLLGGIGPVGEREAVWASLSERFPDVRWRSAGYLPGTFVDDPWEAICRAEVVISAGGQNSVGDIAAAGRPAIVVAQERPFEEQVTTARVLDREGFAVSLDEWPDPDALAEALDRVRSRPTRWAEWGVDRGAATAARLILDLVPAAASSTTIPVVA